MNRHKKAVYCAGPYRGDTLGTGRHIRRGLDMAIDLAESGYTVYAPWCDWMFVLRKEIPMEVYQQNSLEIMERFDCVVLAPNWEFSSGTVAEIHKARELEMPVYLSRQDLEMGRATNLGWDNKGRLRKIILVCGPPAAGKTTWCEYAEEHQKLVPRRTDLCPPTCAYFAVDDFWPEIWNGSVFEKHWESVDGTEHPWTINGRPIPPEQIRDAYDAQIDNTERAIEQSCPLIILEGCYETIKRREPLVMVAKKHRYYIDAKYPEPRLYADCMARNANRGNAVPAVVMDRIVSYWELPDLSEGFNAVTPFFTEGMEDA